MTPPAPRIFRPDNPSPVDFDPRSKDVRDALGAAADAAGATWFQSKLIQPDYRQILLSANPFGSGNQAQVTDEWNGAFDVQSITIVNPYLYPVYVLAGSGGDALLAGLPFPPEQALRLPLTGQAGTFTIAMDPTQLAGDTATIHVFRWPLPD